MRFLAPLVLLAPLAACAPEGAAPLGSDDLATTWRGGFESPDTCSMGEVQLEVAEIEPGWFEGTFDFRSTEAPFLGAGAVYDVRGQLDGGVLVLDQVALLQADRLPSWAQWCFGSFELSLDTRFDAPRIEGAWDPVNCACSGVVELTQ